MIGVLVIVCGVLARFAVSTSRGKSNESPLDLRLYAATLVCMALRPLGLKLDTDLIARIDEARGLIPRTAWIAFACENMLAEPRLRPPYLPLRVSSSRSAKSGVKPIERAGR